MKSVRFRSSYAAETGPIASYRAWGSWNDTSPAALRRAPSDGFSPTALSRQTVGVHEAITFLDEQRILRCNAVKLLERDAARCIGELPRRLAALHHDPVTWLQACSLGSENAQDFAARVDAFEAGMLVPALDGASEVEMVVDEVRDDGCALDVDDLCVGTRISATSALLPLRRYDCR